MEGFNVNLDWNIDFYQSGVSLKGILIFLSFLIER